MKPLPRRGLLLILSSPSGAGKTTLTRMLLQDKGLDLTLSISVTTRQRRSSEVDGVHYHFISAQRFASMRSGGELLESAEVHSHAYGTPRAPVEAVNALGRDMLFDIDWQGAQQVRESLGPDVVSIFVLPPSLTELRGRLERRAEDSQDTIAARLANARLEIERWRQYDYVIINDDLNQAYAQIRAIIASERQRCARVAPGVEAFVKQLLGE